MFRDLKGGLPADAKWKHAYEVFERALELPAGERRGFARSATRDVEVLRLVVKLIDRHETEAENQEPEERDGNVVVEPRAGDRIGRYEIVGRLGQGGMGCVYSARDTDLGRLVALKVLPSHVAATPAASERLVHEAKAASALNHPHIVTVYEVIRTGADVAIAMELVEGEALRGKCGTSQPLAQVIHWGRQTAQALAAAHSRGIVHRDVKPENLMLRADGHIKLLDFGLARNTIPEAGGGHAGLSGPGGTLNYMSPEQTRGEQAVSASDVFSLGIVLFELATGSHPFYGASLLDTAQAISHSEPKKPSELNPRIPPALSSMLLAMLAKEAPDRPSAGQIEHQLAAIDALTRVKPPSRTQNLATAAILALFAAGVALWLSRTKVFAPAEPMFTQITTQTSERSVTAAALSPDGRNLAFAALGDPVQLRRMSDGYSRALSTPTGLRVNRIAWFANGSKLLLSGSAAGNDHRPRIWELPVQDGEPHLLFQDAIDAAPSPDATRVAMSSPDGAEIRVGGINGGSTDLVRRGGVNTSFSSLIWSPDSKRISYQRKDYAPSRDRQVDWVSAQLEKNYAFSYESVEVASGHVVASFRNLIMSSACALPDGQILFLRWISFGKTLLHQMWELRTDPLTGKLYGSPRQLTHGEDRYLSSISAANDGKRIVVVSSSQLRPNIYVADLPAAGQAPRFLSIRRLTFAESDDYPHAWASDNRTIFFESNRNGKYDLFRQDVARPEAELFAATAGDNVLAQVSPDAKWVLYWSVQTNGGRVMMRVPATGGRPEPVHLKVKTDEFQCALRAGSPCVVRSIENGAFVFRELDPVLGARDELARTVWSPNVHGDWALSPDGSEVAIPNHDPRKATIRIVPLKQHTRSQENILTMNGLRDLNGVTWTADGRGWFVCLRTRSGGLLFYVDRQGQSSELLESSSLLFVVPSRDGRHVAFPQQTGSSNAWLVTGF